MSAVRVEKRGCPRISLLRPSPSGPIYPFTGGEALSGFAFVGVLALLP